MTAEEKGEEKAAVQPLKVVENGKDKMHVTYPSPTFYKYHDHKILENYQLHTTWGKCKFVGCLLFTILVFLLVVVLDFAVGAQFAWNGQVVKCIITMLLIYVSSLVTEVVSITW